jgi:queuine/archaeosine tRNA-ribosyltransferase
MQLLQFQIYLNKGAKQLGSLSFLSSKDQGMVEFSSEVGGNRVFKNVTKILSTKLC